MYISPHVKYPLFLPDISETWIFWTDFQKNIQIDNSMKILSVGAELIQKNGRTDWQMDKQTERQKDGLINGETDMTKLIVAFRNFSNSPKNSTFRPHSLFVCFVWISEQTAIISLIQYYLTGSYYRDEVCLLRGRDWIF